jgi:hypothetical protein
MLPPGILDQGNYLGGLTRVLPQNTLIVCTRMRYGVPPIVFNELLRNRERWKQQRSAGIVAQFHGQIRERRDQRVLVRRREQPFSEQPLYVRMVSRS